MMLLDGVYTRIQNDPITVPAAADFVVSDGGNRIEWTDGRTYLWDGNQYETDPCGHAIVFIENGDYLEVHTNPVSYARGTLGPGVQ